MLVYVHEIIFIDPIFYLAKGYNAADKKKEQDELKKQKRREMWSRETKRKKQLGIDEKPLTNKELDKKKQIIIDNYIYIKDRIKYDKNGNRVIDPIVIDFESKLKEMESDDEDDNDDENDYNIYTIKSTHSKPDLKIKQSTTSPACAFVETKESVDIDIDDQLCSISGQT